MKMNRQDYESKDVQLSKSLSWLLRHGASKEGLSLEDGGYIDVQKILNLKQFKKFTIEDIVRVVNNNEKKRFSLQGKGDGKLKIRANQGHSLSVEEDGLLTMLNEDNIPTYAHHGTYISKLKNIKEKGLSKMNRNHIHCTASMPSEGEVISGMRKNCEVIITVDTLKAMRDGFKFYISDNGVILCPGNECGVIPSIYFKEIFHLPRQPIT